MNLEKEIIIQDVVKKEKTTKDTKKEKSEKPKYRTQYVNNGILYEQTAYGEFIALKNGKIDVKKEFKIGKQSIKPHPFRHLDVNLAKIPIDYESKKKLFNEIREHIAKYVKMSEWFISISALYVMVTWVTYKLNTVPYLKTFGQQGSGKSRWLKVMKNLCYKSISSGGAITSAPIFRTLEIVKDATFALDEQTTKTNTDLNQEITQILNTGWQRDNPILRVDGKRFEPKQFNTFGPKLIASREQYFDDVALERRCITEKISKTSGMPVELPKEYYTKVEELKNKLLMFELKQWNQIEPERINTMLENFDSDTRQTFGAFFAVFHDEPEIIEMLEGFAEQWEKNQKKHLRESDFGLITSALFECLLEKHKPIFREGKVYFDVTAQDISKKTDMKKNASNVGKIMKNILFIRTKSISYKGKTKKLVLFDKDVFTDLAMRYLTGQERVEYEYFYSGNVVEDFKKIGG